MTPRAFKKINNQIFRIRTETSFPVGHTNVYFIADSQPTIIDTGPNQESTVHSLQQGLEKIGYHFADIKRILITHPHIDHFGLAARIQAESGAKIFAMGEARHILSDILREWEANDDYFILFLTYCGVPKNKIEAFMSAGRDYAHYGCKINVDVPLRDGQIIKFDDFTLTTIHTPGHTPFDVCFESPEQQVIFVGDTLRPRIAPNVLLARPRGESQNRPRILLLHIETLRRLMSTHATLALPGHGEPFDNPREAAEKTLRHHQRRSAEIFGTLNGQAKTPFEITRELFPSMPVFELFLGVSEVIGHLDALEEEGCVSQQFNDGQLYYVKS